VSPAGHRPSIAVYIVAAFGVAAAAISGLLTWSVTSSFHNDTRHAASELAASADAEAKYQASSNDSLAPQLQSLAAIDSVKNLATGCGDALRGIADVGGLALSVVDTDGLILCTSADPAPPADVYAGQPWLTKALASDKPVIQSPFLDPILKVQTNTSAMAIVLANERHAAIVVAQSLTAYPIATPSRTRQILLLSADRSTVIGASAHVKQLVGLRVKGRAFSRIGAHPHIAEGPDGVRRMYAEAAVAGVNWHLLAGTPESVIVGAARQHERATFVLGGITLFILFALGFLLHRALARPARMLTSTIRTVADGRLDVWAPTAGPAELAQVGLAFNEMNEARARTERRFASLVQQASDVITVVDADGVVRYASPAIMPVTGRPPDDVQGRHFSEFVHPADRDLVSGKLHAWLVDAESDDRIEFRVATRSGDRHLEAIARNMLDDPSVEGMVVTCRDVTERKAFEDRLAHRALHDPLTGLPNRTFVLDHLAGVMEHGLSDLAVVFVDLDQFKLVNDTHGHTRGDELLVAVSQRLRRAVRAGDVVARFGGDEFVVLCDDCSRSEAEAVVEHLLASLDAPFALRERELFVAATAGIAFARAGESTEQVLANADAAMYRAKEQCRGTFAFFDDDMRAGVTNRLWIEGDLRRAVERDELLLHYQPIVDIVSGRVTGVEALVRWRHPTRGLLQPSEFIPVAEETNLIVSIGGWIFAQACRDAARWQVVFGDQAPTVSVNMSARQIMHTDTPDMVRQAVRESGVDASKLCVEVTETALMLDPSRAGATLAALRELDISIAVDDFGTGYSSLAYLTSFPIQTLKIDRQFVADLDGGGRGVEIVRSVIGLALSLRLNLVAEGVENAVQLLELRRLGCRNAQGYYFARPEAADRVAFDCHDTSVVAAAV